MWRANRPKTPEEVARYKELFAKNLVMPAKMELFVMKADGTQQKQITRNGAANFAPYFHPNGRQIIFASNMKNPRGGNFDLYLINRDGTGLTQITFDENFDGFPMFSARRKATGMGIEPQRPRPAQHECVPRRLGRMAESSSP